MNQAKPAPVDASDFSLTACGPIDRLQARLGLAATEPPGLVYRAFALALIAWLPLLLMTIFRTPDAPPAVTFAQDIASHVRFLLVIPMLVLAEAPIGRRTRMVAIGFATSGLIRTEDEAHYVSLIRRARKLADSFLAEASVLVLALAAIRLTVQTITADGVTLWYEEASGAGEKLAAAGWWYAYGASTIALFLLFRWAWRFSVWSWFLRRVAKLKLRIMVTHPDRAGGLGFVTVGHNAFGVCVFALSAMVAAAAANRILYEGVHLREYQSAIAGFIVIVTALSVAPLASFMPLLVVAKRKGLIQYGELASRYVAMFEEKWIGRRPNDSLLGSGDIQSLADLGGSFERLDTMRAVPFDRRTIIAFVAAAAVPMLPLLLTVMPLRAMVQLLLKAMM